MPEKSVLMALAIMANGAAEAWPPVSGPTGLTSKCSMSRRAVQLALRGLEAKGHIMRTDRPGRGAIYRIMPGVRTSCACAGGAHVQEVRGGCAGDAQGCAPHAPKQPLNSHTTTNTQVDVPLQGDRGATATGGKADAERLVDQTKGQRKRDRAATGKQAPPEDADGAADEADLLPAHFVETWNALAKRIGKPQIRGLTTERRRQLKARIAEYSIDDFKQVLSSIERSAFLRDGRFLTFDWIIGKANFLKVLEGNYNR